MLGVNEYNSLEEIKNAYRNLVKIYHPDVNPNDRGKRFKEIQISYEFISKNFKESIRPKASWKPSNVVRIFRVLNGVDNFKIKLPFMHGEPLGFEYDIVCMYVSKEFVIRLSKETILPMDIVVKNITKEPIYIKFISEYP